MFRKGDKKPIGIGLLAGFVASLCCVGPLILITLGIGGASTALAIGKQSAYFLAFGISILATGLGFSYLRKSTTGRGECGVERLSWKKAATIIILSCGAFLLIYYVLLSVFVPWLAPIVYKNFYH